MWWNRKGVATHREALTQQPLLMKWQTEGILDDLLICCLLTCSQLTC